MTIPDHVEDLPPKVEPGGAIGRRASAACRQGQHDLCSDPDCQCRHHGRVLGDNPSPATVVTGRAAYECLYCGPEVVVHTSALGWAHLSDGTNLRVRTVDGVLRDDHYATPNYDKPRG